MGLQALPVLRFFERLCLASPVHCRFPLRFRHGRRFLFGSLSFFLLRGRWGNYWFLSFFRWRFNRGLGLLFRFHRSRSRGQSWSGSWNCSLIGDDRCFRRVERSQAGAGGPVRLVSQVIQPLIVGQVAVGYPAGLGRPGILVHVPEHLTLRLGTHQEQLFAIRAESQGAKVKAVGQPA